MVNKRKKVLIFGAGPAGLGAGVHLLENGGKENFDVTIVNLDHMLGGKAKSWEDPGFNDGRFYDHGIHFVFGFYDVLRELIAKVGVKEEDIMVSNEGKIHWYEVRDRKVHTIKISRFKPMTAVNAAMYDGFSLGEKINFSKWIVKNHQDLLLRKDISNLDNVCFTVYAVENGMSYEFATKSTLFRFVQDALFNWPYEISAYVCLMAIRQMFLEGRNPLTAFSIDNLKIFYLNDGWSKNIWDPIGEYYQKLGGQFDFNKKLVGLQHDGGKRITGVKVGRPDIGSNAAAIPIVSGTEELISDFDYAISTLPMNCFRELNPDDKFIWGKQYFKSMHELTGIAPVGTFAFFKEDIKFPYPGRHMNGTDEPLFNVIDYKTISKPYKDNPRFGSVIHMQGQETTFEHLSDRELVELGIKNVSHIKGFEGLRNAHLENYYVYRGNRNHNRYLLTDPGTYRFRPTVKSPFDNFYLAGDWVQNETVLPCMEGAIRTGRKAADYILEDSGVIPSRV